MSLSKILTSLVSGMFSGSNLDDLDVVDDAGARWVRDWQAQPAQSITPIDTTADVTTIPLFRALRFDVGGTFKFDTATKTGVIRNVGAGEVWSLSSTAITKIYSTANGTSASGIDGLG